MVAEAPKVLFQTTVTDTQLSIANGGSDLEGIGTLRQEGDKWYRWVKNDESVALLVGQPVCYKVGSGAAYHESVSTPVTANLNTMAGLTVSAIPALGFGWVQIEGYHGSLRLSQTDTTQASGLILSAANAKSYMVSQVANSIITEATASGTYAQKLVLGHVMLLNSLATASAISSGSDQDCQIRCFGV